MRDTELEVALVDQPGIDQLAGDELLQILRRLRLHAGGDFLGEQLEQKVRNLHPPLEGEGRRALRAGVG